VLRNQLARLPERLDRLGVLRHRSSTVRAVRELAPVPLTGIPSCSTVNRDSVPLLGSPIPHVDYSCTRPAAAGQRRKPPRRYDSSKAERFFAYCGGAAGGSFRTSGTEKPAGAGSAVFVCLLVASAGSAAVRTNRSSVPRPELSICFCFKPSTRG
jgi:hypothetical protein